MKANTKILGCIADPIDHVKAPTLFTEMFQRQKINAVMIPINVSSDNLENFFSGISSVKNFVGMTVTIPHKTNVLKYCDHIEKEAIDSQSVNWIKFDKDRKLIGNNFDGQGFVNGFKSKNFLIKDKKVCLFGAGGAAIAIACSLAKEQIKSLQIINRDIDKAKELIKKIKLIDKDLFLEAVGYNENFLLSDFDIIINSTSLGLDKDDKLPFDVSKTSSQSIIVDIIMQPSETELLKQAKNLGRAVHYGKYMIESQVDLVGNFLDLW